MPERRLLVRFLWTLVPLRMGLIIFGHIAP
jgi:hypothetical protein